MRGIHIQAAGAAHHRPGRAGRDRGHTAALSAPADALWCARPASGLQRLPRRAGAERVRARAQRWTSTLAAWMCSTTSGCWTPRARTPRPSRSRSGRWMWPRQPTAADPAAWTGGQVSATWTLCLQRCGPLPSHPASCRAQHGAERSGTRRRRRHRRWRGRCPGTGACQGPPSAARPTCRRVPGLLPACCSLPRPLLTPAVSGGRRWCWKPKSVWREPDQRAGRRRRASSR